MSEHETKAREFLKAQGMICTPPLCAAGGGVCHCLSSVAALAQLLDEVEGNYSDADYVRLHKAHCLTESRRAEEWRRRREAESERDTARASAEALRVELATARQRPITARHGAGP